MKGQITIFLCLIMTVVCSLSFTIVRGCRLQGIKWKIEAKTELDKNYMLSAYDMTLRQKYGVFFLPGIKDDEVLERKLTSCAEESEKVQTGFSDSLFVKFDKVSTGDLCMATDDNGTAFFQQAVKEEYQYLGEDVSDTVNSILSLTGLLKNAKESQKEGEDKKNQNAQINPDIKIDENEKKKAEALPNPAKAAEDLKKDKESFWFGEQGMSQKSISLKETVSHRRKHMGEYRYNKQENHMPEDILFVSYLMRHFSNYTNANEDGLLSYELEYILKGKSSDKSNVRAVAFDILAIREACNFLFLLGDAEAKAQAEAAAVSLTGYLLNPVITEAAKYAILLAWSSGESILDVKNLLDGKKVPFLKKKETWQLSLAGMIDKSTIKNQRKQSDEGLSYEEYLKILLVTAGARAKTMQVMDVMEWEVRRITQDKTFKMDDCVAAFQATYQYTALGKEFSYVTQAGY